MEAVQDKAAFLHILARRVQGGGSPHCALAAPRTSLPQVNLGASSCSMRRSPRNAGAGQVRHVGTIGHVLPPARMMYHAGGGTLREGDGPHVQATDAAEHQSRGRP